MNKRLEKYLEDNIKELAPIQEKLQKKEKHATIQHSELEAKLRWPSIFSSFTVSVSMFTLESLNLAKTKFCHNSFYFL